MKNTVSEERGSTSDVLSDVLDFLKIEKPAEMTGQSLFLY